MPEDSSDQKNWFERLSHLLLREPKDREQLVNLLRDAQNRHLLSSESLAMIEGVLQVSDMKVRDIMIPRAKMTVIDVNAKFKDILPVISETKHSRFPVIGENKDEVLGILLAKELLPFVEHHEKINVQKIMRPAVFIPESKRLNILLREFRLNHNHMAIVVDEYGAVSGLVTIEDVLEQIVGEIEDESDIEDDETHIHQLSENRYTVKAWTPIDEFNTFFKTEYSDEEFDTIGGLVMHEFGHLPKRDEMVSIEPMKFKILHADNRRIRLLQVSSMKKAD